MRNWIVIYLLILAVAANAQDVRFSNFASNSMYINPALTGQFVGHHKMDLLYRSQWMNWDQPYTTYMVSAENTSIRMGDENALGLGLFMLQDKSEGLMRSNHMQFGLSSSMVQLLSSESSTLSIGFQGMLVSKSVSFDDLSFSNQITRDGVDTRIESNENYQAIYADRITYPDMKAGIYWRHYTPSFKGFKGFDLGVSMHHLLEPLETFELNGEGLPVKRSLYAHQSTKFTFGYKTDFRWDFLYSQQENSSDLMFGGVMNHKFGTIDDVKYVLTYGAKMRLSNEFVFLGAVNFSNTYIIGFAYDMKRLVQYRGYSEMVGTFEIKFTMKFGTIPFGRNDIFGEDMEY